jgi:hypothetical protein
VITAASRRGGLVARALTGAWRAAAPPVDLTMADVREIQPLLLHAGAGGLAWARVRGTPLEASLSGGPLHHAYLYQALAGAVREARIIEVMQVLRAVGVEPILGKGWAVARMYPDPGWRPCGDIDVYVRRVDHGKAALALRGEAGELVDLHCGYAELDDWPDEELLERSQLIGSGEQAVRLFGREDHLRLLALHSLRHGLMRSLWLCDVARSLESIEPGFDWAHFCGGRRRRAEWAEVALEAAHALLGAGVPDGGRARARLPGWLVPAVLEEWGTGRTLQGARVPVGDLLRRPSALLRGLVIRWPNPVEATVGLGRPFGSAPPFALQIAECLRRGVRFGAGGIARAASRAWPGGVESPP